MALTLLAVPSFAAKAVPCAANSVATLQACINSAPDASVPDSLADTIKIDLAKGSLLQGKQIRINYRKNVWITGDTSATATDATRPRILYQDTAHTYTDTDAVRRADTSLTNTFGQNNGTVWIHKSINVRLQGLVVDGNRGLTDTANRIFAYPATLGKGGTVEIRGNVGVSVLLSRDVQIRYVSVTNAWYGITILSPNLGGAYAFPDPNDPPKEVMATVPTSKAGLYGNHLIERCRIFDNVTGIFFWRDWDLSSVVRNNLFWGNYLRHWDDPKYRNKNYIANLYNIDNAKWFDGKTQNLRYTTVGGALYMTDVALTPYRIHNNTFYNNSTIVGAHYKSGTQHLFYNNLIGRPYQFHRDAVALAGAYTQTERQTEMLQFYSEHQRANRVVSQDGLPTATQSLTPLNIWGKDPVNLRLFRMRMIRTTDGNSWPDGTSWSNDAGHQDSLPMTWVPDTLTGTTSVKSISDTGGVVKWIRNNMWAGTLPDIKDGDPGFTAQGWSPPYLPHYIHPFLAPGVDSVFRDVSGFDVRWTLGMPFDTSSPGTSNWLAPATTEKLRIINGGWASYEGSGKGSTSIGAIDAAGKWSAPARRLVLRDTLIESIKGNMVKFNMNISGQGIDTSEISDLKIYSAKFYNDVPVSDTIYNQGILPGSTSIVTRPNSILSRKAWVSPYDFQKPDWDRPTYSVDDSLKTHKLGPRNTFIGAIANPLKILPDTQLYARAEVVLVATLKDGSTVYSNPGVFMFSRPRFQFDVRITRLNGDTLPLDVDGISRVAIAREPLRVVIKQKTAKLPVPISGYANLLLAEAGLLLGSDGNALQTPAAGVGNWNPLHPNDTLSKFFPQNDSVVDTIRDVESATSGTLIYRARFQASNGGLLPYYLEGRADPLRIASGAIFQVTIDSVFRDTLLLTQPDFKIKTFIDDSANGKRDTLLADRKNTSWNLSITERGDYLRLVLQVRDRWGSPVLDSSSAAKGLYVKLAHVLAPGRYRQSTTDPSMIALDSAGTSIQSERLSFGKTGQVTAYLDINQLAPRDVYAALRAVIVDTLGRELGTSGTTRQGIPDTTWFRTTGGQLSVQWVDTFGVKFQPKDGWVGDWIPVRLKMLKDRRASTYTGSISLAAFSVLGFHSANGDTSLVGKATFANDTVSHILWLRASDSTTVGWIKAASDSLSDSVGKLRFRYPTAQGANFFDANCNGLVDSLVVKFNGPVAFRLPDETFTTDSVNLVFPHQFLSPSVRGPATRVHVRDSTVQLVWSESLAPVVGTSNRISLGNPLAGGKSISFGLSGLLDKAKPVVLDASDFQSWTSTGTADSFVVKFSEALDVSNLQLGAALPFELVRNGAAVSLSNSRLVENAKAVDSGVYSFVVHSGTMLALPSDSIRTLTGQILDLAGNTGAECKTTVLLKILPTYRPKDGYVIDVNGDGNADSVHLAFSDTLGVLPEHIFIRWGTPAETLTVLRSDLVALGVKTSDTAFTVPTKNWHGQTIVIDGLTIPNAPRTVGPADTAYFVGTALFSHLLDRVPPVVVNSKLVRGISDKVTEGLYDTLTVDFSEPVSGCPVGTDPSKCLTMRDRSSKAPVLFGAGSIIGSQTDTRWVILIPQISNSISLSTELRATPVSMGGLLVDKPSNGPGEASPWVKIPADIPPPKQGWMLDMNGDGRVDAVLLRFLKTPPTNVLPSYQFEWGTIAGAAVTLRADSAYPLDSLRWIAVLNQPGEFGATAYGPASLRSLGTQLTPTLYKFPISDSVGPVLLPGASLKSSKDSLGSDTLIVRPSESLANPTGAVLLEFRRKSNTIAADQVVFLSATALGDGTWRVVLGPNSPYRPNSGDEVRLSTSGSVRDMIGSGNVPSPNHPWVVLTGNLRQPYFAAYYDRTKDGRIETAEVFFAAPVPVGTKIQVSDPAGSGAVREYVVQPQDSANLKFVVSFPDKPWGQDVTSWSNTMLGNLVPSSSVDTSVHGGKFPISDRVEPVVVKGSLRLTSDTSKVDTFTVKYSERILVDPSKPILFVRSTGDSSDLGTPVFPLWYTIDSATLTVTFYLHPFPRTKDTINPSSGSWIRLTPYIADAAGNRPETKAKWTQVDANDREMLGPPVLTNPVLMPTGKPGDIVPQGIVLVTRPTKPGNNGSWSKIDPVTGKSEPLDHVYSPTSGSDFASGGNAGTVFHVTLSPNITTKLTLYIYDLVGTFVVGKSVEITPEALASVPKSEIGMVDVGILWLGQDASGRLVGSGIYPSRLIVYREPTEKEKAAGHIKGSMYNRLMKVGVNVQAQ